ncbi:MAG: PD-(D/E)XK nuclease family protein [Candidatus Omnitrophica bacterium]|nr:PD-(D/E)XK nuclease family protein [Candidatus Omnitrophota bacterium]
MKKLKSELTWSFSRDRLFNDCRRAYFYHYYASWGGWEARANQICRKAYILKNMRSIDAWIGDIVHQVIKWILKSKAGDSATIFKEGRDISHEEAVKTAKSLLTKTWEQSRNRRWEENIKQNLNLFEHYYNHEPSREQLKIKLEKVANSIRNFYKSGLLEKFSKMSNENFLSIDELDSFNFEGTKTFAIPDFAIRDGSEYLLYDWKTGKKNDKDIMQLSCYSLFATSKWQVSEDQIKVIPAYLAQDEFLPSPAEALSSEQTKDYIRRSIEEMKSVLLDTVSNKADINDFSKTDILWRCQRCKFREICS